MSRALGPRPSIAPGGTTGAWMVLGGCWASAVLGWLVWAGAAVASAITGGTTEPFGIGFISDVLHDRTRRAWPHTPTALVAVVAVVGVVFCTS